MPDLILCGPRTSRRNLIELSNNPAYCAHNIALDIYYSESVRVGYMLYSFGNLNIKLEHKDMLYIANIFTCSDQR